jgi:hypothetical protein
MKIRIKVFAFFYNEECLAQFFISHYRFADCIHAFLSRSTDRTREILSASSKVEIEDFEFPSGIDDFLKVQKLNDAIGQQETDFEWYIVLDADEFVWPAGDPHAHRVHEFLAAIPAEENVLTARMWNVFRHKADADLDPSIEPVVLQRRHGIADRSSVENSQYQKPIVIRPNHGFKFWAGHHALEPNSSIRFSSQSFDGAHWGNADPAFCIKRRIQDRRDRQSQVNLKNGLGIQDHHVQESEILSLCAAHQTDPQVF